MKIELHRPESGDWTVAILNGVVVYSGHDNFNRLSQSFAEFAGITVEEFEYTDEEFEEKF